jgi:hypothetical protein
MSARLDPGNLTDWLEATGQYHGAEVVGPRKVSVG